MDSRLCLFILVLNLLCVVCVTSRPFAPNDGHVLHPGIDESPQSLHIPPRANEVGNRSMAKLEEEKEDSQFKEVRKIGSSAPSCDHKCFGCMPCEAIQVPTTSSRVGVQYANYEPEGWKCKCGPAFYSP